ncbi:MAG: DNA repair exonuclease [Clostridia bacterium]|nr:DNA repair exonuclease [Clostridia bacterium]
MLRFLHVGDLHLGSSFSAFSPRAAAVRRARAFEALEAVIADALQRQVDLLLFAGDCFDSATPDPDTAARFFDLLARVGLPVVIAPGNHDPYRAGSFWDTADLPANVCLFREESLAFFELPELGVNVYGYAFIGETAKAPTLPRRAELPTDRVNLLLAHADLLSPLSPYAPITSGALAASGFAYAALGHVHKPMPVRRFGDTVVAYSGFLVGRGFDECGAGQANLVEINGGRVNVTHLESTADRFEILEVDCTGADRGEEVRGRVAAALNDAAYSSEVALRVILRGAVSASCVPDVAALSRLGTELALFEVRDETLPLYDVAFLEKDLGLRGAFYRAMQPRLESDDEDERAVAAEALRLGFTALAGRDIL